MSNNLQPLVQNLLSDLKDGRSPSQETLSPLLQILNQCSNDPKFKEGMREVLDKIIPMSTAMIPDQQQKSQFKNNFQSICNAVMPNVLTNDSISISSIPSELSEIVTKLKTRFDQIDYEKFNGSSPFGGNDTKPFFYPKEEQSRDEKMYGVSITDTYINSKESGTKSLSILLSSKKNYDIIITIDKNEKTFKVVELK